MDWKINDSTYIVRDRWLTLRADSCEMSNGTKVDPYYVFEYPHWINVLAITKNKEIVLTRQYRHCFGKVVLELPSGCMDKEDAEPLITAKRELAEETGYTGSRFYQTSVCSPNPANHTNMVYSFLALDVEKTEEIQLDESEDIETVLVPLDKFIGMFKNNEFVQSMHVASIYYGLEKLKDFGL